MDKLKEEEMLKNVEQERLENLKEDAEEQKKQIPDKYTIKKLIRLGAIDEDFLVEAVEKRVQNFKCTFEE